MRPHTVRSDVAVRILAGRYELNERIGEGGMAVVFRSRDRLLDRNVAIKILRPEYTKDLMFIESFRRESQLAASIVDPNIVNVYDVGKEGNIYYIVMELVEGEPLSEIIKREAPLDPRRAANITRQIASALSTAHKHQLIHRDVKPHNVLVSEGDVAKISDFGIAIKARPEDADSTEKKESVMGSIHYFSPEQARGAYVDERSDIYSLGIVLYEMLTGKVPFDGETAVDVALKHMNEPMVPPSRLNPDIPQDLEDIVMKATAKLQTSRYASADDMITALNLVKFSRPSDYSVELAREKNGNKEDKTNAEPEETPEQKKARIRAEKKAAKRRKLLKRLAVLAGALVVLVGLIIGLGKLLFSGNKSFQMPYLIGMKYTDSVEYLKEFELFPEIDLQLVSTEPAGTILSQTPEADTKVKRGQTVKVNVSRGSSEASVPILAGSTQATAEDLLKKSGYTVGDITGEHSDSIPKGLIISQDPAAGTPLEKGEKVNMVVSLGPSQDGPEDSKIIVPNVTQKTLEAAKSHNEKAGLAVGTVTEQHSTTVAAGRIISQSPSAGNHAEKGSQIALIVSTGAPPVKEGSVDLTLDYSKAKEDSFQVTVTLQDGGASTNVFVEQRSKTSEPDKITLIGKSETAKVKVFYTYTSGNASGTIDTIYDLTVNFQTGTVQ